MILNKIRTNYFLSSMVFNNDFERIKDQGNTFQYPIEFSSGLPFSKDAINEFVAYEGNKMVHNYFPASEAPFVLNLASSKAETRKKSIQHCFQGIKLSAQVGAPFYCAHAGFIVDPTVEELGKKFSNVAALNSNVKFKLFIDAIEQILAYASEFEVDFYIENNVIAPFNYTQTILPFFCCESQNILSVFDKIQHPRFGLLLDTAHLKVSCTTLNLSLEEEFLKIKDKIKAIHHSDNDGLKDNNQKISTDYWFLKYVKDFKNTPQVLEVKNLTNGEIEEQLKLLELTL